MLAQWYLLDVQMGFILALRRGSHLHIIAHLTWISVRYI